VRTRWVNGGGGTPANPKSRRHIEASRISTNPGVLCGRELTGGDDLKAQTERRRAAHRACRSGDPGQHTEDA